jgi:hypothetical protein
VKCEAEEDCRDGVDGLTGTTGQGASAPFARFIKPSLRACKIGTAKQLGSAYFDDRVALTACDSGSLVAQAVGKHWSQVLKD